MVIVKAYEHKQLFTNSKGFDLSKLHGTVPQKIGQGFQFKLDDKIYTTTGRYSKDGKRIVKH